MTNTVEEFRSNFFALVEKSEHIVVTAHMGPDDDSIGSVMAMHEILSNTYPQKDIRIMYSGPSVDRYGVLARFHQIEFVDDIANHLEGCDLLVVLDVNQYNRISKQPEKLAAIANKIVIDHHASAPDAFTLSYIDTTYSSNAELVYGIFVHDDAVLTKTLAESILLGILGDTGNFSYISPAQTNVFLVAKKLVEKVGTSIDAFRSRYGGIPLRIIPILQTLVANMSYTTVDGWPPVQYTYIETQPGQYSDEDMSAASHIYMGQYLPRVEGYGWGFVLTPRADGAIRISTRALPGTVNVRVMLETMGIGGGHDRASGGSFKDMTVQQSLEKILDWIKTNKPAIV